MNGASNAEDFENTANKFLKSAEDLLGKYYSIQDNAGNTGTVRHIIWSEVLMCSGCGHESTFWESCVQKQPLKVDSQFVCPHCTQTEPAVNVKRSTEIIYDQLLDAPTQVKKRVPVKIYGKTGRKNWNRSASAEDQAYIHERSQALELSNFPLYKIKWGMLHRKGYHQGITHLHQFYTRRNAGVFSQLWQMTEAYPAKYQSTLRFLLLSYNSSHATLMTRVVVKSGLTDFVITGAQSGVLYISNLPVEKNILEGIKRKIKTISNAFREVEDSKSQVTVVNKSSTAIGAADGSVQYVFTDPPFGDYIPYSEINQINEAWLGKLTETADEVIVNTSQQKKTADYQRLMENVLVETGRVMHQHAKMSLVFHSAKSEIWRALSQAVKNAGFAVAMSSVLDKQQPSFKQTNSDVTVKGDPIILLSKEQIIQKDQVQFVDTHAMIRSLVDKAVSTPENMHEIQPERLFSRYTASCLELGITVSYNADEFYQLVNRELQSHPIPA